MLSLSLSDTIIGQQAALADFKANELSIFVDKKYLTKNYKVHP